MLSSGLGKYLAPTSLGLGYAIIKIITLRILNSDLASSQELTYHFLGGILLGFALRPVAIMIYWRWETSIAFFSTFLMIHGPVGQIFRQTIWGVKLDNNFWLFMLPEFTAAFGISILATIMLPSKQKILSIGFLWRRFKKAFSLLVFLKLIFCGLIYAVSFLILQSNFDESFTSPFWTERLGNLLKLPPISVKVKIVLLFVQGVLNALVLFPLFLIFFRDKIELIVIFGSLSFIVSFFTPAFANFQRIEPLLLLDQVFIGFCLNFIFVSCMVFFFGKKEGKK